MLVPIGHERIIFLTQLSPEECEARLDAYVDWNRRLWAPRSMTEPNTHGGRLVEGRVGNDGFCVKRMTLHWASLEPELRGAFVRLDQGTRIEADVRLAAWRLAVRLVLMVIVVLLSVVLIWAGLSIPEAPARVLALMGCLGLVAFLSWCRDLVQWLDGSKSRFLDSFVRDELDAQG